MKKLLASIITALLIAAGLVATSGSASTAAPAGKKACPYTNCVSTNTQVKSPTSVKKGKRAKTTVLVTATGNTKPRGTIKVKIKPGKKVVTARYVGGKLRITLPKLKPGKYSLTYKYLPKGGSIWKKSFDQQRLTVKKKRK